MTNRGDPKRKRIVVAVIVAVIMGVFVGCGKDRVKVTDAEIEALSKQIKDLVTALEYSDKVAEDFCQMVLGWKDAQGQPVLVVWKKKVHEAKKDYKQDKMSKIRLAKVEESIARKVGRRIRKEISRKEKVFDLADAIKHRQANCLGCSQLLYLLGNSTELSVKTIHVTQTMDATLSVHMACIVGLTDGNTMMVDLTFGPIMSKPFKFEKEFRKLGNYWELIDKHNPLGIHRRIQILDKNGLISYVYYNQGTTHLKLDQQSEAIPLLDKAIELNPKFAEAYTNRGLAYAALRQYTKAVSSHTKAIKLDPKDAKAYLNRANAYHRLDDHDQAISDYTKAIELNPKYAIAYSNRGIAYGKLRQLTKAISDYTKAIELNPKYAKAYYRRGLTYALLGKYKEAKKDLLTSVKLDPALKADVKEIYMKLFEFPLVDFKLDTSAGSRNK